MLEFDREKFRKLYKDNGYNYKTLAETLTDSYGIDTKEPTVKSWMTKKNPSTPEYERISAMADLFGVPSLQLFTDGERELEKNIEIELKLNPEKYKKYFERDIKSEQYSEIINALESMDEAKLQAIMTLIKG